METVKLSLVQPETMLVSALKTLRDSGKSGIVVKAKGTFHVLAVGDLLEALRADNQTTVGRAAERADPNWFEHLASKYQTVVSRADDYIAISSGDGNQIIFSWRDRERSQVSLIGSNLAEVHFESNNIARMFASRTILCECQTDNSHVFLPIEVNVPGKCNNKDGDLDCK